MTKKSVLIIDDEEDILELVKYNLSKEGYSVLTASTGEEGIVLTNSRKPDLIILDLMLPGIDGLEVCRTIKNDPATRSVFILMLTAKGDEADVVSGLELGADDYLVKPFSPRVLLARVRSVLRRDTDRAGVKLVRNGEIVIDPDRHEVTADGAKIELTRTEFRILHLLATKPGIVFSRYQIVDQVHGDDYPVTDRSIDVQIVGLRKKLGTSGGSIVTVRGVGYKFADRGIQMGR